MVYGCCFCIVVYGYFCMESFISFNFLIILGKEGLRFDLRFERICEGWSWSGFMLSVVMALLFIRRR